MRDRSILFVIFVLIEIALLVELGRALTTGIVLTEILVSAFIGYMVIKHTARLTGMRASLAIWKMQLPAQNMIRSFIVLVGGIFLIIPGLLSDLLGILLILPITQAFIIRHFNPTFLKFFKP